MEYEDVEKRGITSRHVQISARRYIVSSLHGKDRYPYGW